MNYAEFQLRGVGDPRLAVHATSAMPAWLWSVDGTQILWANPVGARVFGAASGAAPNTLAPTGLAHRICVPSTDQSHAGMALVACTASRGSPTPRNWNSA